jgi:curved DNA-binding protein CbpA
VAARPTHYDVLDVAPDAAPTEIRKAYLALARQYHPDFHTDAGAAARAANEREMQRINDAWSVLSDEQRRAAYDRSLRAEATEASKPRGPGSASYDFTPIDDDDTDYAALLDEAPIGDGARVSRGLQMLPVVGIVGGLAVLALGLLLRTTFFLAFGVIAIVFGVLSFIATPVVAIMRSYRSDPDG